MVNTFHFHIDSPIDYEVHQATCAGWVTRFYNEDSTSPNTLGQYISSYIDRDVLLQCYDMELPPGAREPTIHPITLEAPLVPASLPEEVALVVTLEGAPPVTARRRGRLFIGPFVDDEVLVNPTGASGEPSRPATVGTSSLVEVLAYAAGILMEDSNNTWCIRSVTPSENYVPIVSGYVDNAWDTQRRRGPDPTARRLTSNIVSA